MLNIKNKKDIIFTSKVPLLTAAIVLLSCAIAPAQQQPKPLVIAKQGSFMVGGGEYTESGIYDNNNPLNPQGQTIHGDHAYVFYQIPAKARQLSLVFLHGAGQSKKTWESTPDGREGFQNLFLRRGYPVYLVDQPRRGSAGRALVETALKPTPDEQFWFSQFRLGNYPDYFEGVQFPKDKESLAQFYRQMTPNTGAFDANLVAESLSQLVDKIGPSILITHSQGGGPGWWTAIDNKEVKAIVAYEPYSGFVFPTEEVPDDIPSTGLFGALKAIPIPMADFLKLTRVPIIIYYGDNIANVPSSTWNMDHWRSGLEMAKLFADTINKHGGDATVVHLPEVGIPGNTHFPFSDLNNIEIADQLSKWLKEKGLDR